MFQLVFNIEFPFRFSGCPAGFFSESLYRGSVVRSSSSLSVRGFYSISSLVVEALDEKYGYVYGYCVGKFVRRCVRSIVELVRSSRVATC